MIVGTSRIELCLFYYYCHSYNTKLVLEQWTLRGGPYSARGPDVFALCGRHTKRSLSKIKLIIFLGK